MATARVILFAEDNDDDFVLLRCAFESAGLPHRLIGVSEGADAVNYLYAEEPFTNRSTYPFPDLMLLDLNMPVMDGFEVLAAIKGRTQFQCLPIVVLSSVDDPLFIQQALKFGATDFLIKPVTMDERIEMARRLQARWFKNQNPRLLSQRTLQFLDGSAITQTSAKKAPLNRSPRPDSARIIRFDLQNVRRYFRVVVTQAIGRAGPCDRLFCFLLA